MCESDASVPRRALDDGASCAQQPSLFGILDNVQRCPIFYTTAGVLEFGFAEYLTSSFGREAIQADERSVSNR